MGKRSGSQCEVDGLTHYERNKAYYKQKAKESKQRLVQFVQEAKAKPCADCGVQYPPCVMDFDHLGDDKAGNVSRMVYQCKKLSVIQAEIDKCEVVCANCHRIRTNTRAYGVAVA